MKKLLAFLMTMLLICSLFGCSSGSGDYDSGWGDGYRAGYDAAYNEINGGNSNNGNNSNNSNNSYNGNNNQNNGSNNVTTNPSETQFILPELPLELSFYGFGNDLRSSVKVLSVTFEQVNIGYKMYFSGEKLYDKEGNQHSDSCKIGWKLYDEDGFVVESGTVYSSNVAVGEKFKDAYCYVTEVEVGKTYRLELLDSVL